MAEPVYGLDQRVLGSATLLEPHAACDSATRGAMRAGFLNQMLVLKGANKRRLISGVEREYGKYTLSIKMPCDARVLKIIRKYPKVRSIYEFSRNPETVIIYESLEDGEIGSVKVFPYHWNHKVFGYEYRYTDAFRNLSEGSIVAKDTILADSYTVQENGDYWYGFEAITAFMSVPGVIEDGIVISESLSKKLQSKGYGSKVMEWGVDYYPLNTYGKSDEDYKIFPDIGERVRNDGIIFALRKYDPILAVCDMTPYALRLIDHTFDKITYVALSSIDSTDMPIVEDVSVWHTHNQDLHRTPERMENQVRKYHESIKMYHTEIDSIYERELRRKKDQLKISRELHNLVVDCRKNDNNIQRAQLSKSTVRTFRRQKLDDWRVQLTFSWTITPTISHKMTNLHGGKGVICAIRPDADMPTDDNGVSADIIVGGVSTISRTNFGSFNEHYITATLYHVERLCKHQINKGDFHGALKDFMDFLSIASPVAYEVALEHFPSEQQQIEMMLSELKDGFQLWLPQYSPNIGAECIQALKQRFPLPITPVTYRDGSGKLVRTVNDVLLGSLYMVVLEKIGDDWGATSIPKRQHHGIPGKLTDADKSSLPWRDQAFKIFGESETRLMLGVLDPMFASIMINFPNSPAMCADAAQTLLTAEKPTGLKMAMDYRENAKLPGRSNLYFNHMMAAAGLRLTKGVL